MNIQYPTGELKPYYDRNPAGKTINYASIELDPHTETQRAIYTVPAGKRALIEHVFLYALRTTESDVAGLWGHRVVITVGGAGATLAQTWNKAATRDTIVEKCLPVSIFLDANDVVVIYTQDESTNGNVKYWGSIALVEFDK